MKVKVQTCWHGHDTLSFRAVIGGGIHVYVGDDPRWTKAVATAMLNQIERSVGISRKRIRFDHV